MAETEKKTSVSEAAVERDIRNELAKTAVRFELLASRFRGCNEHERDAGRQEPHALSVGEAEAFAADARDLATKVLTALAQSRADSERAMHRAYVAGYLEASYHGALAGDEGYERRYARAEGHANAYVAACAVTGREE